MRCSVCPWSAPVENGDSEMTTEETWDLKGVEPNEEEPGGGPGGDGGPIVVEEILEEEVLEEEEEDVPIMPKVVALPPDAPKKEHVNVVFIGHVGEWGHICLFLPLFHGYCSGFTYYHLGVWVISALLCYFLVSFDPIKHVYWQPYITSRVYSCHCHTWIADWGFCQRNKSRGNDAIALIGNSEKTRQCFVFFHLISPVTRLDSTGHFYLLSPLPVVPHLSLDAGKSTIGGQIM